MTWLASLTWNQWYAIGCGFLAVGFLVRFWVGWRRMQRGHDACDAAYLLGGYEAWHKSWNSKNRPGRQ